MNSLAYLLPRVSHFTTHSSKQGETLVGSGHMSPRIWEITAKLLRGMDKMEILLVQPNISLTKINNLFWRNCFGIIYKKHFSHLLHS